MSTTHKSCKVTIGLLVLLVLMVGTCMYHSMKSYKCGCMNEEYFIKYAEEKKEGLDPSQRAKRVKEGLSDFSQKYLDLSKQG